MDERIEKCENAIGYRFKSRELLAMALRHASAATDVAESNQRLEFLGDAVLTVSIAHYLYERFPEMPEGELTRVKSLLVSRQGLVKVAGKLKISEFIELGSGMEGKASPLPKSILADAVEAVIGAVYVDGGFEAGRRLVLEITSAVLEKILKSEHARNYKSILQHLCQVRFGCMPEYEVQAETGPDHSKEFEVIVKINGEEVESAWGRTKKEAEQLAAQHSLQRDFPGWEKYDL